jgi:hypothetical protein
MSPQRRRADRCALVARVSRPLDEFEALISRTF